MQNPGLIIGGRGLGIFGAIIGGTLGLIIYTRWKKLSALHWLDILAPGVILAQAIGRWGNYFNQELYGYPTDLPWAIYIDPAHRLPGYESYSHFHPLFLYESLWNFMNMGILLWLGTKFKDRLLAGDLVLVYAIIYPLGRFLLEFVRLNSAEIGGINANQAFMLVIMVASGIGLFLRYRVPKKQPKEGVKAE